MTSKQARALGDLALLGVIFLGVALLFIGASTLPPPRFEPLGSAAMPRILGAALVLLSLPVAWVAIRDLMAREADAERQALKLPYGGALVLATLVAYVAALDFAQAPFVLSTTAFVAAIGLIVDRVNLRVLAIYGGLGLILSNALLYVFSNFLYVQIG
ncbi:hypothetical protein E2K80_01020 [Rhodophyticola sp. CCM32]|uniref:tripartite tricarboxylate transporter TctB family protein n=1 Tax=Rhodophyticola sp. CCM32 TaxID=2916397 RepID=UPI00107F7D67|nr:tripartite tricarboxylate transporter TctB family protein [Rhodophyticola sp. CCM32]QBX99478.1 hypothetical protein E2K80_01020 [Rhodophyticola sp. CCM32]